MTAGEFQHLWRPPALQDLPFCSYKHWLVWLCAEDFCDLTFRFWGSHCVFNFNICGVISCTHCIFRRTCCFHQLFRFTTFPQTGHFSNLPALQATEAWETFAPRISESSEDRAEHEDEVTYQQVIWTVVILKAGLWELLVEILAAVPLCL